MRVGQKRAVEMIRVVQVVQLVELDQLLFDKLVMAAEATGAQRRGCWLGCEMLLYREIIIAIENENLEAM